MGVVNSKGCPFYYKSLGNPHPKNSLELLFRDWGLQITYICNQMPSSLTCLWVEGPFCLAVRITPNAGVQPLVDKAEVSYLKHSLIPDGVLVSFNDPPPILSPLVRQWRVWSICSGHSQYCSRSHHNKGHQRLLHRQWRDYREHNKLHTHRQVLPICVYARQTKLYTHAHVGSSHLYVSHSPHQCPF